MRGSPAFSRLASWMAQSSEPGPVPLPIATTVSMPACCARASMASRSASNCDISRCAWESTNKEKPLPRIGTDIHGSHQTTKKGICVHPCKSVAVLFQSCADGNVFQEPRQHRRTLLAHRRSDDHPVRFQAAQLARLQVHD